MVHSSAMEEWGSRQNNPCAGCKFLRRKCQPDCIFAPHFLPEQHQKFALVHRIFGASNVSKILIDLQPREREDAVISLVYEANMQFLDPIYGCVSTISALQKELRQIQFELSYAFAELSRWESAMAALEDRKREMEQQNLVVGEEVSKGEKETGAFERQIDFAEDDELRSLLDWQVDQQEERVLDISFGASPKTFADKKGSPHA